MKRTYIRRIMGEFNKTLDQIHPKSEVMQLTITTCINKKKEMFARVEAIVEVPSKPKKTFRATKDFDL